MKRQMRPMTLAKHIGDLKILHRVGSRGDPLVEVSILARATWQALSRGNGHENETHPRSGRVGDRRNSHALQPRFNQIANKALDSGLHPHRVSYRDSLLYYV